MHFREQGLSEEEAKLRLYYFCDTCGKSYANKASLRLHKLHVHEKYSEEVPCDVCGISFRTRELLKQHQEREHSAEPKFVCEECGQRCIIILFPPAFSTAMFAMSGLATAPT